MTNLIKIVSSLDVPANLSLLLTIVWVIEQDMARQSSSAALIGQYAKTKASELDHKDLIGAVLERTSGRANIKYLLESINFDDGSHEYIIFDQNLSDEDFLYRSLGRKQKGIWFIDSLQSFAKLERDLMDERYNYKRNGFFCIVWTGDLNNLMDTMRNIFQRLFKIYIINVNFLVRKGRLTSVFTYQPFSKKRCHDPEPQLHGVVGAATGYNFSKPKFFLKKLTNMWGCTLRITTWHEPPFIVFEGDKIKGIEGLLLEEMAAKKNFRVRLKKLTDTEQEYLYPKGTHTGFMRMLVNKETNITIVGLMYDKDRLQSTEAAYTYMNVPLVVAIPNGLRMTPWERIIRPFKYIIWSCFSSSILVAIIVIFSLKRFFKPYVHRFVFGGGTRTPFTNLWNVLYGGPIHGTLPSRNFSRYLLAIWLFYTWVLRSAYIGELFILLNDSRARSYLQTVAEVVSKNFTFYTYPLLEPVLHDISIPASSIRFIDSQKNSLRNLFKLLGSEKSKIAVTILAPVVQAYNRRKENWEHQINVLPESLFMAPLTFYMPKHSYLTHEFDDMLLSFLSAGLLEKYSEFYVGKGAVSVKHDHNTQEKLSLWLLLGIFSIYLFLLILCGLVFLFELRSRRSAFVRKIVDFFNY